ncbi:glycosyltransferase, partial [Vibrio sp. Isolate31]|uniref:glycosyltransferase n=1 Tax=Vibrio sp. Isolate31 TaxID=2908537 RepID=UPI001EFE7DD5
YIVSVGRLTYAKGHWHLIRAFSIVNKRYPDLKLVIVGKEEADQIKSTLDRIIRHFGLEDSILFLGHLENPYPVINNAEVLALSSIYEGLPGVVIESFACGTPVVASNNGGQKELLLQDKASRVPAGPLSSFITSDRGCLAGYFDGTILDIEDLTFDEKQFAEALIYVLDGTIVKDDLLEYSKLFSLDSMIKRYNSLM